MKNRAVWELNLINLYLESKEPHGRIPGTSYKYYTDQWGLGLVLVAGNSDRYISFESLDAWLDTL